MQKNQTAKKRTPRPRRRYLKPFAFFKKKRVWIPLAMIFVAHVWLHFSNPYANLSYVQQPFTTHIENGKIVYRQHFEPTVLTDPVSDGLGYYKQGFMIVQNTLVGGQEIHRDSAEKIIDEIHTIRFDPSKPYLISGDQFSVLYPRNLGVFYNTLMDPNTAHNAQDWENRQRIYLQSALYAIEGLSASDTPKTTLVPVAPRVIALTSVHPGDLGSDAVYGMLYALNAMRSERASDNGAYRLQTKDAIERILREKKDKLHHIVDSYITAVQDPSTKFIKSDIKLASARDGVTRSSSMYDNIILWKTIDLANQLGIRPTAQSEIADFKHRIKARYWDGVRGHYHNDINDKSFSSDFLIGYPTGFFNLDDPTDLERSKQIVRFVEKNGIASPLPIKYQIGQPLNMPYAIKKLLPLYGGEAIWSYWGAQYITLLSDMYRKTDDEWYKSLGKADVATYDEAIVRDGGFAETYNPDGSFLRVGLYKSIRITGWVVQYEHAKYQLAN